MRAIAVLISFLTIVGCTARTLDQSARTITIATVEHARTGELYEINISAPVIGGIDSILANRVNQAIEETIETTVTQFLLDIEESPRYVGAPLNELRISFDPFLVNPRLVSIRFLAYRYTGGAHGSTQAIPFNFDLERGQFISLRDLFQPDTNYLEQLSVATRTELAMLHPEWDQQWLAEGTAEREESFSAFALSQDLITIFFQQYQVGPYVIGMPEVTIPLRRLQKILLPSSISDFGLVAI